jgi:hypothetical protein
MKQAFLSLLPYIVLAIAALAIYSDTQMMRFLKKRGIVKSLVSLNPLVIHEYVKINRQERNTNGMWFNLWLLSIFFFLFVAIAVIVI